ncbi:MULTISPECIES: antirestriction protein ArdA [Eubacteriales]|jgi:hypothetical protein|uniref:Antirestriction protein ArdA n=1 Tax=Sinanaerobacter chloroacetimidivorans TaxID=2818044 RepID=A0A8J7W3A7_9FIRM|nr:MULTISPECIES: antirestriction protein ArdA [Eubacteriales]AEY67673.1 hypothetical protein Clo1100_3548 [Clostridium sp. BNL1100]MBR0600104.1 antirestriction protein ArdA [Sinanaerobacter chloroacetimidivorans]
MSEKEKVMTVTLMRSDLYDAPAYSGAYLKLPASRDEIQDALHRARVTDDQPYQVVECFNMQGEELSFIPENPPLAELNFLAYRISELSEHDRIAFTGCALVGEGNLAMHDLINQTYNLGDAHAVPAKNDRELGKFYVDNDFIDAVNHVPPEYQQELLDLLDYEKIGRARQEAEGGIFHNDFYVVNGSGSWETVYDGIHLPEQSFLENYVFELLVCDGTFYPSDIDECTILKLPATPDEISEVLKEQGIKNFDGCVVYTNKSSVPKLNGVFGDYEDIEKIKLLAEKIYELRCQGQEAKFKAALELMDCTDIDLALDITQNMDCFDFYPELSSPEDYARQEFLKRYHIPEDDPMLKHIHFSRCDSDLMKEANICATPYGIIRLGNREMTLEYSSPALGQQML